MTSAVAPALPSRDRLPQSGPWHGSPGSRPALGHVHVKRRRPARKNGKCWKALRKTLKNILKSWKYVKILCRPQRSQAPDRATCHDRSFGISRLADWPLWCHHVAAKRMLKMWPNMAQNPSTSFDCCEQNHRLALGGLPPVPHVPLGH